MDKMPSGDEQPEVKFYAENAAVSDEMHWLQGKINDIVQQPFESRPRSIRIWSPGQPHG